MFLLGGFRIKPIFAQEPLPGLKLILLVILAIAVMALDYKFERFGFFHKAIEKLNYPVYSLVSSPFRAFNTVASYTKSQHNLVQQLNELKQKNLIQSAKLQKFEALSNENQRLKLLLNSSTSTDENFSVATIIQVDLDPFMHQVLLNKGSDDGVFEGQPVIDAFGVVGQVTSVSSNTSRVMLITDASQGIPVENLRTGNRAIATGVGNMNTLELPHVPNTTDIQQGDVFVTSGMGARYPSGYRVGKVTKVERDLGRPFSTIHIEPIAHLSRTRHLLLIHNNKQVAKQ